MGQRSESVTVLWEDLLLLFVAAAEVVAAECTCWHGFCHSFKKLLLLLPLCMVPWYHGATTSLRRMTFSIFPHPQVCMKNRFYGSQDCNDRMRYFESGYSQTKLMTGRMCLSYSWFFLLWTLFAYASSVPLSIFTWKRIFRINQWKFKMLGHNSRPARLWCVWLYKDVVLSPLNLLRDGSSSMSGFCVKTVAGALQFRIWAALGAMRPTLGYRSDIGG